MTESQFIIERISPIELRMLHDRGVALPHHLLAKMEAGERKRGSKIEDRESIACTPRMEARREGRVTPHQGKHTTVRGGSR